MKTFKLQTKGSQFIKALFADKNFQLANSFCEFPLTFTFENTSQKIYDTKVFAHFFAKFDKYALDQIDLLSEKVLFEENSITTLFMELAFPLAHFSAAAHFTLCNDKIRSFHFFIAENSTNANNTPDTPEKQKTGSSFNNFNPSTQYFLQYLMQDKYLANALNFEQSTDENSRGGNFISSHNVLSEQQKTAEKAEKDSEPPTSHAPLELNIKIKTILEHANVFCWEYYPASDQGTMSFLDNTRTFYQNFTETLINFFRIAPDSREEFIALHDALKRGEADVSAVIQVLDNNGEIEWRNIRYSLIPSKNSELVAVGTSKNISDIKNLKSRFSLAATQSGLYMFYYDIASRTLNFTSSPQNNTFKESSYHVPESFLNDNLIHPLDYKKLKKIFQRIENKELQIKEELRFKDFTTNQYSWFQVNFVTILDSKKNIKTVMGSAYNIQHQKHVEETYNDEFTLVDIGENDNLLLNCIYSFKTDKIIDIKSKIDDLKGQYISLEQLRDIVVRHCPDPRQKEMLVNIFDTQTIFNSCANPKFLHDTYFTFKQNEYESCIAALKIILLQNPNNTDMFAKIKIEDRTIDYIRRAYIDKLSDHKYDFIFRVNYNTGVYKHYFSRELEESLGKVSLSDNYYHDSYTFAKALAIEEERKTYLDATKLQNILSRLREEGEFSLIFRTVNKNNEIRYNRTHFFMLDENTQTFCEGSVDITDSYNMEKENDIMLHKSLQIAQEAIRAKSNFLASLSHDIRTPMNSIIGMANLALEEPDNQKQAIESLNIIKSSSENLLYLINNFLDINRMESGALTEHTAPFNIKEVCADIAGTFKGIVIKKNQNLEYETYNISNDHVLGDESNLRRILTNLLGNAVKFTPSKGSIFLRLYQNESSNPQLGLYKIEVEDTGIGIAKEDLAAIFEPYKRENTDTIKHIEGTGLGLAIVKTLVEMQGGSITVESEKGKGTKFILHLEYKPEENTAAKKTHSSITTGDIDLKGKHILLVEDHPVNRLVAAKLLEKMGAAIIYAENGKEAVEKFVESKEGDIDFIFMDIQMPVMNGFEATKAIRNSNAPHCKQIPIIAMTANAFNEDVQKCLNAGMDAHIAKPISLENISNTLKKLAIIK